MRKHRFSAIGQQLTNYEHSKGNEIYLSPIVEFIGHLRLGLTIFLLALHCVQLCFGNGVSWAGCHNNPLCSPLGLGGSIYSLVCRMRPQCVTVSVPRRLYYPCCLVKYRLYPRSNVAQFSIVNPLPYTAKCAPHVDDQQHTCSDIFMFADASDAILRRCIR